MRLPGRGPGDRFIQTWSGGRLAAFRSTYTERNSIQGKGIIRTIKLLPGVPTTRRATKRQTEAVRNYVEDLAHEEVCAK